MLQGITRAEIESYHGDSADGRIGAYGVARKQDSQPSAWEKDAGKFVHKAAVLRELEKRGDNAQVAYYANYHTGERLFVTKANGMFVYDHPAYGMPRQGHIKEFEKDGPFVQKGEQIDRIKEEPQVKAGDTVIDGNGSTDGASGNDSFCVAQEQYPKKS